MIKYIKNRIQEQKVKGFTVVEIIVVVAMLAIATSIAMPNFLEYSKDADAEIIQSELDTVRTVARNLVEEKEYDIEDLFKNGSPESERLKGEIKSVTNFDDEKIDKYSYGVDNTGNFVVHFKDNQNKDYYWDGQKLENDKTLQAIDKTVADSEDIFEVTGGFIPEVESDYFTYNSAGNVITGLTDLGREHFKRNVIVPEKKDNVTIGGIHTGAFQNEGLETVYIPPTITKIGSNAFVNNGDNKNSDSIESANVDKYYNGITGNWKVVGSEWKKMVHVENIIGHKAGSLNKDFNFAKNVLPYANKVTIVTRKAIEGYDNGAQGTLPSDRPIEYYTNYNPLNFGKVIPGNSYYTIENNSGTNIASGTVSVNLSKPSNNYSEKMTVVGTEFDEKNIKEWQSKNSSYNSNGMNTNWGSGGGVGQWTKDYLGYFKTEWGNDRPFRANGTTVDKNKSTVAKLKNDTVINGGTDAHSINVSGVKNPHETRPGKQPSSFIHYKYKGDLNEYSGRIYQDKVNNGGTDADSYYVEGVKGPNGISDKVGPTSVPNQYENYKEGSNPNVYSGTLNKYHYSGYPRDTKWVSGVTHSGAAGKQPTQFTYSKKYGSHTYTGTVKRDKVISGLSPDSKYVDNQASKNYNKNNYKGTLSPYTITNKKTFYRTSSKYSILQHSKKNLYKNKTVYKTFIARTIDWAQYDGKRGGKEEWSNYRREENVFAKKQRHTFEGVTYSFLQAYSKKSVYTHATPNSPTSGQVKRYTTTQEMRYEGTESVYAGWVWDKDNYYISQLAANLHPSYYTINESGYSGRIYVSKNDYYVKTYDINSSGQTLILRKQDYAGTLSKGITRYKGTVERADTRKWNYKGTLVRPDTRKWRYRGEISKPDTRLWDYKGTISKPDTRKWSYSGLAVGDTREFEEYYFYQIIIE